MPCWHRTWWFKIKNRWTSLWRGVSCASRDTDRHTVTARKTHRAGIYSFTNSISHQPCQVVVSTLIVSWSPAELLCHQTNNHAALHKQSQNVLPIRIRKGHPHWCMHRHTARYTGTQPQPARHRRRQTTAYSALCTCSISVTDSHSSLAHAARPPLVRCAIWIAHAKNFYPLTFFPPFHNYYIVSLLHHPGQPVWESLLGSIYKCKTPKEEHTHIDTDTHLRIYMQLSQHHTPSHSQKFSLL